MNNYYFTYLMQEHGKQDFNKLISNILVDGKFEKIKEFNLNDWSFIYFFSVYFCTTLKYFGLSKEQINMCLDIVVAPGWNCMLDIDKMFKVQKRNIVEIEKILEKEFKEHHS